MPHQPIPNFPEFPLPPKTQISFNKEYSPFIFEYQPGQVARLVKKDVLDSYSNTANPSFYTEDIAAIEEFLFARQFQPFKFNGLNYVCLRYTIDFVSDNKGTITLDMAEYSNPSFS